VTVKAAFWATVAAQFEPDPDVRKEMAEMAQTLVNSSSAIKTKTQALLAAGDFPPE
jgi:hypothetical protein